MSVLASCHLPNGEWSFDIAPESPSPDIEVGFTADVLPVEFDGLTFGLTVVSNGLPVFTRAYPTAGVRYVATDQQYISNDRVSLAADDEVALMVWMENAGERSEASTTFVIPRPEQPYPSWTWEDGAWTPPVPYPDGDAIYSWDEEQGDWVAVEVS